MNADGDQTRSGRGAAAGSVRPLEGIASGAVWHVYLPLRDAPTGDGLAGSTAGRHVFAGSAPGPSLQPGRARAHQGRAPVLSALPLGCSRRQSAPTVGGGDTARSYDELLTRAQWKGYAGSVRVATGAFALGRLRFSRHCGNAISSGTTSRVLSENDFNRSLCHLYP